MRTPTSNNYRNDILNYFDRLVEQAKPYLHLVPYSKIIFLLTKAKTVGTENGSLSESR